MLPRPEVPKPILGTIRPLRPIGDFSTTAAAGIFAMLPMIARQHTYRFRFRNAVDGRECGWRELGYDGSGADLEEMMSALSRRRLLGLGAALALFAGPVPASAQDAEPIYSNMDRVHPVHA